MPASSGKLGVHTISSITALRELGQREPSLRHTGTAVDRRQLGSCALLIGSTLCLLGTVSVSDCRNDFMGELGYTM